MGLSEEEEEEEEELGHC